MTRHETTFAALLAIAGLLALPGSLAAEEATSETTPETTTEGRVELGAWDASEDGALERAAEYETTDGGPDLGIDLQTLGEGGSFTLTGEARDEEDLDLEAGFDVRRMIRSHTRYTGLPHRLIHDDLDNLEATTNHGRVVRHTDLDPDGVYRIDYSVLEHRTDVQLPGAENLTFGVGYRRQERDGERQLLAVSHCDACHVVSRNRPIDESTEDVSAHLSWAWRGGELRGSFEHRELTQNPTSVLVPVDDALHPELRKPLFDNRIQFSDGELPGNLLPDVTKARAKLQATFARLAGFAVDTGAVWSRTENDFTDLQSDYLGYVATASRRFGEPWRLAWRGRYYTVDNDDVFVDTAEPVGIAGPQAGKTYREIYGFDPDFLRLSALDREVLESKLDLAYRIGWKAGTVKLSWDFEGIDRDHYAVTEAGETDTTTNAFELSWKGRPRKGIRLEAAYEHGEVENPFTLVNGQFSTQVSPSAPNPFAPQAAQYHEFQDARIAETTASPESWDRVRLRGSYGFGSQLLSASYTFWDGDNDEGDLTDWSRTRHAATATIWIAPVPDWQGYATYAYHATELDFPASIPIFDG